MLQNYTQHRRGGFTLVEVMIAATIISLLAAIAAPAYVRARKRSQATRIMEDLRLIDGAIDQYAVENNKCPGDPVAWSDIKPFLKTNTVLYSSGSNVLGADYTATTYLVDETLATPDGTSSALGDIAPAHFWSPYLLQ